MIIFRKINIKNGSYYFFNDMINIKHFDPNLLSIDKTSFKSIDAVTYHIKYITMKSFDHVNIDCENSLYLVFNNVDGYIIKENNEDKYLNFAFTNKNKEVLQKQTKLWNEIKSQIETINGGTLIEYKKDFMKISFESDDDLPFTKILSIPVIIITGSVFQEGNEYYPQVLLHELCINLLTDYRKYPQYYQPYFS